MEEIIDDTMEQIIDVSWSQAVDKNRPVRESMDGHGTRTSCSYVTESGSCLNTSSPRLTGATARSERLHGTLFAFPVDCNIG